MLRERRWVLERHVIEANLILELDSNTDLGFLGIRNLGLALNHSEDESAESLSGNQTLYIWKSSDETNEASEESDQN